MASASNGSKIEYDPLKPVNEAVAEYRVIEDGALAHYLQEREIEHHHAQNVVQRRTVMGDIKTAKDLQDEEDRKARILTLDEQEELKDLDGQLAEEIQEELVQNHVKEEEERKRKEIRDNEIARKLTEREKRHYLRQQEQDQRLAAQMADMRVFSGGRERRHPASDEELARRLQEQEKERLKQKSDNKEHIKTVIEMQDAELARFIHEKEMEEAEWMAEQEGRKKKKSGKQPRGEPHSRYPPPDVDDCRHYDPPEMRRSSKKGPKRPPQPQERGGEAVSRAVPVRSTEIPLDQQQRRSAREQPLQHHTDHHSSSDRPRRPPQPKDHNPPTSSTSRDHPDYIRSRDLRNSHKHSESSDQRHDRRQRSPGKSRSREHVDQRQHDRLHDPPSERSSSRGHRSEGSGDADDSDNPWKRFPHGASAAPGHSGDDITYGEGFARLTEQEAWNRDPNFRESAKRKNKGDCKQQ